jgi:hypothetical protein
VREVSRAPAAQWRRHMADPITQIAFTRSRALLCRADIFVLSLAARVAWPARSEAPFGRHFACLHSIARLAAPALATPSKVGAGESGRDPVRRWGRSLVSQPGVSAFLAFRLCVFSVCDTTGSRTVLFVFHPLHPGNWRFGA